jgi:hypothetical protein
LEPRCASLVTTGLEYRSPVRLESNPSVFVSGIAVEGLDETLQLLDVSSRTA